jgi:CRP/FNR family transcriptional regulator, cyclic AMP receptor protein
MSASVEATLRQTKTALAGLGLLSQSAQPELVVAGASSDLEPEARRRYRWRQATPRIGQAARIRWALRRREIYGETAVQAPKKKKKSNGSSIPRKLQAKRAAPRFDTQAFLTSVGVGRSTTKYRANKNVFRQGDPADAVFYIQRGKVKLTVVSEQGKEGVIAILDAGDFFGEGCLAGQPLHMASVVAITDSTIVRIEIDTMIRVLREEPKLSEMFMTFLLSRNIQFEADLVDQLFNSSERRLARILLLLANFGKEGKMETVIPKISQEVLAAKVGTTRSRVNFFMNKFRKLGFIEYNGGLKVHSALLNIVVHD